MRYYAQRNAKIKKLLRRVFPKVSVIGHRGTAAGWIDIHLNTCIENTMERREAEDIARKMIYQAIDRKEFELSYYWDDMGNKRDEMLIMA